MKDDINTPVAPTAGIDWATDTNQTCIVDSDGQVLHRSNTTMDAAGIRKIVAELERFSINRVAIERPDGPVVDALLAAGLEVVVITPRQIKNLRSRYGAAGNKDDRFDAFVLADTLRTDPGLLRPLQPDSAQTMVLRQAVRARGDLVETRVALCNQLRAHLKLVFPGAVGLFATLDSPISLAFLTRFPTTEKAAWLSHKRLGAWLSAQHYPGRTTTAMLLERIDNAPAGLTGNAAATAGRTTLALVEAIQGICQQIRVLEADITEQFTAHPDSHIFASLPRSGKIRAAKLLAEIGDARGRYPTADALAALAGACPSTRASGRHHVVSFRWACDKKLRDALMDFAGDSRHASPWAAAIYDRHRTDGKTHQHTVRILARAWIRVIWRCWQDGTPYDPSLHGGAQARLTTAA
jgi:transposase